MNLPPESQLATMVQTVFGLKEALAASSIPKSECRCSGPKKAEARETARAQAGHQGSRARGGPQESRAWGRRQVSRSPTGQQESRAPGGRQEGRAWGGHQGIRASGGRQVNRVSGGRQVNRVSGGRQESRAQGGRQETRLQQTMVQPDREQCRFYGRCERIPNCPFIHSMEDFPPLQTRKKVVVRRSINKRRN